jgi:hypothetical protein
MDIKGDLGRALAPRGDIPEDVYMQRYRSIFGMGGGEPQVQDFLYEQAVPSGISFLTQGSDVKGQKGAKGKFEAF